jgi:hypothetical protein
MTRKYEFLTDEQVEQFLAQGYVVLHDCFPRELAEEWKARAFVRLGYDPANSKNWKQTRVHMPTATRVPMKEFAPRAWGAACELLGGEARVRPSCSIGDGFIINFRDGARRPWEPPSAQSPGWHKDGDFFRHFLDSPEQGLLTLILWSDIEPRGGGTFVASDSVPVVARFLAAHPEGILPRDFDFPQLAAPCRRFVEVTGRVGDIVLLHPYILHAASQNHSGRPRFLTNPPIALKRPMNFHRARPESFSQVEQAVLRALEVERLDFRPTAPRQRVVPNRVRVQRQMLRKEAARLRRKAA